MSIDIHFLNVGHGDCTIVEFGPSDRMMIDINNSKVLDDDTARELAESFGELTSFEIYKKYGLKIDAIKKYEQERLTDPVDWYIKKYGRDYLRRYVQTHPDMDHMTGLYRLHNAEGISIIAFWDTQHSVVKTAKDFEGKALYDFRDWQEYQRIRRGYTGGPVVWFRLRGERDGATTVWAPFEHHSYEQNDCNSLSYVLFIDYYACRIVLGGDAPTATWERIYNSIKGAYPKINLLKAPHHGRKTGYHQPSVKAMRPDYTVVSVGKLLKKDDAFASYEKYSEKGCYSTRFAGDIKATCWMDGDVWLYDGQGRKLT